MQLVEPTLARAALLWWSISWRSLAYGLAGGVIAGVIMGVVGVFAGWDEATLTEWSRVAGFAIAIPSCVYAAYSRIGKVCGDFCLVLVRAEGQLDQEYSSVSMETPEVVESIYPNQRKVA